MAESRVGAYDNSQHTAVTLAVKLTRVGLLIRRTRSQPSFRLCATSRVFCFIIIFEGERHAHVPKSSNAHVPDVGRNFPLDKGVAVVLKLAGVG